MFLVCLCSSTRVSFWNMIVIVCWIMNITVVDMYKLWAGAPVITHTIGVTVITVTVTQVISIHPRGD